MAEAADLPEIVLAFLDGELMYGSVAALQLDDPFLEVELHGLDGNNRQALVPASSVRQIDQAEVAPLPPETDLEPLPRVALHFVDGQVFRAHVVTPATLQRFGAVWEVVEAETREHRIFAIPYTALKAAFYVRHWDTRRPADRQTVDLEERESARLAEIHARRARAAVPDGHARPTGLLRRLDPDRGSGPGPD